jgi:hypothetical protein
MSEHVVTCYVDPCATTFVARVSKMVNQVDWEPYILFLLGFVIGNSGYSTVLSIINFPN